MKILFLLCMCCLRLCNSSFAQDQHLVDSLRQVLSIAPENQAKVITINRLARILIAFSPDTAIYLANTALALAAKLNDKSTIRESYSILGYSNKCIGNYVAAVDFYQKELALQNEESNKIKVANIYYSLGCIRQDQGNFAEALLNYLEGLKIFEENKHKKGEALVLNNIGVVYFQMNDTTNAFNYFRQSLNIYKLIDDKQSIAGGLSNLGYLYLEQGNYTRFQEYTNEALKIYEELKFKYGIANCYINIGDMKRRRGEYDLAIKYQLDAFALFSQINKKYETTITLLDIGKSFEKKGDLDGALKYLNQGLIAAKEIGALDYMRDAYKNLAGIYFKRNNFREAYLHEVLFKQTYDSIYNKENEKKLTQQQMQYDFDKKEAASMAEQQKKDAVAHEELQRQKLVRNGFMGGFAVVLLFAAVFFTQRNKIKKGKKRSDELLLNILPSEVAEELKAKGSADAKQFDDVTVMFTDFKDFTQISEKLTPSELVAEIHTCFKAFDIIITKHNIEKIKTIGDSFMCAGGLPVVNTTNASDVVNAAMEIQKFMLQYLQQRKNENKEPFEIRIGIHTGPVVAGIVGVKKFAYDIWGDTVNIASRMESSGEAGKVNISGSTYQLVKDKFKCSYRGKIQAKHKGEIDMYFVETVS